MDEKNKRGEGDGMGDWVKCMVFGIALVVASLAWMFVLYALLP